MWKSVRELPGALVTALEWIAGVAAATLPKRWWPALDAHLPVTESATLASVLTVLIAAAIGVPGFVDFTTRQVSLNNRAILDAATDEAARPRSA